MWPHICAVLKKQYHVDDRLHILFTRHRRSQVAPLAAVATPSFSLPLSRVPTPSCAQASRRPMTPSVHHGKQRWPVCVPAWVWVSEWNGVEARPGLRGCLHGCGLYLAPGCGGWQYAKNWHDSPTKNNKMLYYQQYIYFLANICKFVAKK